MKRAVPAAIITAVGLGALASFRTTTVPSTKASAAVVVPRPTVPASPTPPTTRIQPGPGSSTRTSPPVATPAPTAGQSTTVPRTRTVTGDPSDNRYGTVQVQVTLQGSQIMDVVALQMPDSHQRSVEISQQAEPILRQEALQAQSAQIDIVSGATFTSQSYVQSLQAALDRSHG
jgi:uncharacterized protein with FMN-binding domain